MMKEKSFSIKATDKYFEIYEGNIRFDKDIKLVVRYDEKFNNSGKRVDLKAVLLDYLDRMNIIKGLPLVCKMWYNIQDFDGMIRTRYNS